MRTRTARKWGAAILIAAVSLSGVLADGIAANATGAIAPEKKSRTSVTHERAIITWDGTTETIELALSVRSKGKSVGLVFPTPTPAKVTAGKLSSFEKVEKLIAPRATVVDDWWGTGVSGDLGADPKVLDRVKLGPIEATTIAASNSNGLSRWLKRNKFSINERTDDALAGYINQKWSFVAVKLDATAGLTGSLDPVRFTFKTTKLVYPIRLNAALSTAQSMRLYVFDDHRVAVRRFDSARRSPDAAQKVVWAGTVTEPGIGQFGRFLTVVDLEFDQPRKQVRQDLQFTRDTADDAVTSSVVRYNPITLFGLPAGLLAVGWAGFGLILGLAWVFSRFRSR